MTEDMVQETYHEELGLRHKIDKIDKKKKKKINKSIKTKKKNKDIKASQ